MIETRKCGLAFCLSCCFHWNSAISISTDFSEVAGQISGCVSIDESSTRSHLSLIAFMSSYTWTIIGLRSGMGSTQVHRTCNFKQLNDLSVKSLPDQRLIYRAMKIRTARKMTNPFIKNIVWGSSHVARIHPSNHLKKHNSKSITHYLRRKRRSNSWALPLQNLITWAGSSDQVICILS